MNAAKTVGKRTRPETPEEFHALGAVLDREIESLRSSPRERFVFRARTWDELERFQAQRLLARQRTARPQ
ncbi:MAG: hypothetical protein DMF06_04930 [Verrucomicrobia bacterium]|nr:MAG: hypothetical protein DMF06_04930 [Verrucomicrobiota bacterium]